MTSKFDALKEIHSNQRSQHSQQHSQHSQQYSRSRNTAAEQNQSASGHSRLHVLTQMATIDPRQQRQTTGIADGHSRLAELERMRNRDKEAYEERQTFRLFTDPKIRERALATQEQTAKKTVVTAAPAPLLESLHTFPTLGGSPATAASSCKVAWGAILANKSEMKIQPATVISSNGNKNDTIMIHNKNKTIYYIENSDVLYQDLMNNTRLEKTTTDKRKTNKPDQDGFRTVIGVNNNVKKTFY